LEDEEMRIDKYLKVARIIKRRTIANEACSQGRVLVNDRIAKPGTEVKIGDIIEIRFGEETRKYEVLQVAEHVLKGDASDMYRVIE
jgi:ribosomal 50S subunit-recycling heat shock protein